MSEPSHDTPPPTISEKKNDEPQDIISPEIGLQPTFPDGGLQAWLTVLGV
jgi:hypothetical protein